MYSKSTGVTCEFAENGAQALAMAKEVFFDLIILDIQMPVMDGLTAFKEIKALKNHNSTIPILAFSAFAAPSDAEKYLGEGFSEYLTKPLSKNMFVECLLRYIQEKKYLSRSLIDVMSAFFVMFTNQPLQLGVGYIEPSLPCIVAMPNR